MQKNRYSNKERNYLQSVIFQLNECIDAFNTLNEINKIHENILASKPNKSFLIDRSLIVPLVGIVRDSFCIRLTYLFDKRKDVHSLKKYFKFKEIDNLYNQPVTKDSIKARNGNIAHLGKKYIKWPSVETILSSNIQIMLNDIKIKIMFPLPEDKGDTLSK